MSLVLAGALLLLAIVVLVLAAFLFRRTGIVHLRSVDGGEDVLDPGSEAFAETLQLFTGTHLYAGNRVQLLMNGEETYPALFRDLRSAGKLITWFVFWFRRGRLADELCEVLCERARSGVRVLVLYDWFGTDVGRAYFQRLRAAGVEVAAFRPPRLSTLYKLQQRMHVRAVTIDGCIGYTGGFAIADCWLGDGRRRGEWRDTNVRVEGPIVDQLQAAFATNWAEATHELLVGRTFFDAANEQVGSTHAGLMRSAPSMGCTNGERLLVLMIRSARSRLYVTSGYFVPESHLLGHLVEAARDGVDVRILHPGPNTDQPLTLYAARHRYEALLEAGVRIFEYRPTMIHAKTLVLDGRWATVGTMNFDNRSLMLNDETTLIVRDAEFARQLERAFLADLEHASEVRLEDFRRRSRIEQAKEALAARFASVL